ncbi:MAG: DUF2490 domain-containing protein, partial [Polaribacter sp.]|nr:DUF2490 domain-containing protein [Polaribacter sp.]
HKISEKFALETMAHYRYYELANNFQQEIYRLGVNYTFNPKANFTIGYSYVDTDEGFGALDNHVLEHRIYEDLNVYDKWGDFKVRHRIRLEHRFINPNITNNWFRYDLNINYPLSDKFSIYAFNEILLHMDRQKVFNQNWTGFGTLFKVNDKIKLNFGYFQINIPNDTLKRLQIGILLNTEHFDS